MRVPGDSGTGKLNNQPASAKFCGDICSVSDPYSFDTDPDPAFEAEYRFGSGSRVLITKKWEKNLQLKKIKFFWTTISLSLGLHK
jgi:hypothetical protein